MEHQCVLLYQNEGQRGDLVKDAQQLVPPRHAGFHQLRRVEVVDHLLDAGKGGCGRKHRPDDNDPPQFLSLFLKAGRPDKSDGGAEDQRTTAGPGIAVHPLLAAENGQRHRQRIFKGAVALQQLAFGVIMPGVYIFAAGDLLLE